MSHYQIGVIGCGWVGTERHIPSYKADSRATIQAVYDHNPTKAQNTAEKQDIPHSYSSVEEFLEQDLDIVSICTPPWTHAELTIQALNSGCNVLSEKPMAMTTESAQRMVDTADEAGKTLGIVHNFLYADSMMEARKKVNTGEIGDVKNVIGFQTSSPRRHLPTWYPDLPGGLFYDESPHLLYLMEEFLGHLELDSISADYRPDEKQTVQMVNANFKGDDRIGTLMMMFDAPLSEWHLTVVGTKKILVIDIFRDILICLDQEDAHNPTDVLSTSMSAILQEVSGTVFSGIKTVTDSLHFGMNKLVSNYLDALDEGSEPPVTGRDSLRITANMHEVLNGIEENTGYTVESSVSEDV